MSIPDIFYGNPSTYDQSDHWIALKILRNSADTFLLNTDSFLDFYMDWKFADKFIEIRENSDKSLENKVIFEKLFLKDYNTDLKIY